MAETGAGFLGGCRKSPLNGLNMMKRPGEISDDFEDIEFMNKQSSDLCTLPKELLLSNGRSTPQLKSQVRILHREDKNSSIISENHNKNSRTISSQRSSKHCKSLQQREAEYAEARLRIFGCLPPDDNQNVGSETGGDLAKTPGCSVQKQRKFRVTKPATSSPSCSPFTNQPKGTLLRRPTNGAIDIVTQLDSS